MPSADSDGPQRRRSSNSLADTSPPWTKPLRLPIAVGASSGKLAARRPLRGALAYQMYGTNRNRTAPLYSR
jgi:hypothetical protein